MSIAKIAVSIDNKQLEQIDFYVKNRKFKSRSQIFRLAISDVLEKLKHKRLSMECAKLDIHAEQEMADMGLVDEDLWPKY
jgi:metal-responsive CopG/Arc/MetJ family transcriptional regulator